MESGDPDPRKPREGENPTWANRAKLAAIWFVLPLVIFVLEGIRLGMKLGEIALGALLLSLPASACGWFYPDILKAFRKAVSDDKR